MIHFIRCFLNKGVYNDHRIIKQNILEQMYTQYPASDKWPYNLGLVAGIVKNRTILNHNGGDFGFLATQDIVLENGLGVAALTNSVKHPNKHIQICQNMWNDLFDLQNENKVDCKTIPDNYETFIGVYEVKYERGSWKLSAIPRNGALYCNNQKMNYYKDNIFFIEKKDCIEFITNGMKYDNVLMNKVI